MTTHAWVSLTVAATRLGEHPTATYLRIGRRELRGERLRVGWMVDAADLERLLATRPQPAPAP